MYLEYITIHGFKSFANKTTLDFRPAYKKGRVGITAIVGPNGSGKSNVVDAIRWGLGEQSSKTLRGKKSEDVIFAGSDKKVRNSRAEVSLRLNNENKKIELDYSEIELTRQLFRNGESYYLINKQKSRLQDIHYLLAQANIGQKSYTVIGQGMIDTVLNSTPQQRKEFFDEAAGVKQYQIKKEQALHKLNSSKENLTQGEIQLQEITPRLRSLTRQMKRLEQREQIIYELQEKLNNYYARRWQEINLNLEEQLTKKIELEKEKDIKQKELDNLQNEMQKLANVSDDNTDSFAKLQEEYSQKLEKKNQLSQQLAEWQGKQTNEWLKNGQQSLALYQQQINNLNSEIRQNKQQLTNTYEEIKSSKQKLKDLETQQKNLLTEIKNLKNKLFSQLEPNQAGKEIFTKIQAKITSYLQELEIIFQKISENPADKKSLNKNFSSLLEKIKQALNELPQQTDKNSLTKWQERLKELEEKKDFQDQQILNTKSQIKYLEEKAKNLSSHISQQEEEKKKIEENLTDNQADAGGKQTSAQEKINQLSKEIEQLNNQLSAINQKLATYNQAEERKKREIFNKQEQSLEIQRQLNNIQQNLTDCEIKLARWQTKRDELKHSASQDFTDEWEKLTEKWKNQKTDNETDLTKLETEIQQLKNKKEMIGAIDDETIKEYEEISERHAWLEQQTADLGRAIESLENIIIDLDKKIEEQFTSNIKLINEKFSHYFSILFQGGKAELRIRKENTVNADSTDEEDENQKQTQAATKQIITGVDIVATPPGKRLQSISMLSGGEKALTSIALICAIIANNSSPFVVLDEVDAALDEANSLRFAQILEELSSKTQFIVVTHNRATMEKAQLLYGVTMGADGVSKLLSIKLEEGQKYTNR